MRRSRFPPPGDLKRLPTLRRYGGLGVPNALACRAGRFNSDIELPYSLRHVDFRATLEDVYDLFCDVNTLLVGRGLKRLADMVRPAILSGVVSELVTASLAKHSRSLAVNSYHNGHPDLVLSGQYPDDAARAGSEGVEIKSTVNPRGAVDTHGARPQWLCVFVYEIDTKTEPVTERVPLRFTAIYLAPVTNADFRSNPRATSLGTRTASLHKDGLKKLRDNWVYLDS